MKTSEGVVFLQWALPRLGFRWPGFRKVRRQVLKRLRRRLAALGLGDLGAYRALLESDPAEWEVLDSLCRITISRFYRDRRLWYALEHEALPALAVAARERGAKVLHAWSAGCASGEEPYTLKILWQLSLRERFPDIELSITASDADPRMLERARRAGYGAGTLKELPVEWRADAFECRGDRYRLRSAFRHGIDFVCQDLRRELPASSFDLLLCRNLAFTYFDEALQRRTLRRLVDRLAPGGVLVVGTHESLPVGEAGVVPWPGRRCLYRRTTG